MTMEHKYKEFPMQKSEGDAGTISGYFSTYDRIPDSYGDVIAKGAFTETIAKRKESGHPFPLCWNHDLNMIIGSVDPADIEDTDKGPLMTAKFFNSELAQEKREIVKSGVVFQFSFAYDVLEAGPTELEDGTKANELRKLDLFEVSIVPIPANQNAVMTEVKAGRRNRKTDEDAIRQIISLAQSLLDDEVNDADDPDDGEDNAKANTAVEEPAQSNPRKDNLLTYINTMEV
jgi:HK97 family phage prohead protease